MDIATFRADFPEFSDATAYPDSGVTYWLNIAGLMIDPLKWGSLLNLGTELFVAHNLVLERQAQKAASAGGAPGINTGPLSAKAVDRVSAAYDTQAGIETGAGHWNLTVYGTRFMSLVNMFGAGGCQVC